MLDEKPSIVVEESPVPVEEASIIVFVYRPDSHDLIIQVANGHAAEAPPARPWTPSYSVTRQGPGSDVGADEEAPASVINEKVEAPAVAETNGNGIHEFPSTEEPKIAAK